MRFLKALFLVGSLAFLLLLNVHLDKILPEPYRIIVMGTERSGATALYVAIKNALNDNPNSFFEPTRAEFSRAIASKARKVIVKINLSDRDRYPLLEQSLEHFGQIIFIVRDPRDILVSSLLSGLQDTKFIDDERRREIFIEKLDQKVERPGGISLFELFMLREKLERQVSDISTTSRTYNHVIDDIEATLSILRNNENIYVVHYEDFVDDNLKQLENYLGRELESDVDVTTLEEVNKVRKNLHLVGRTKSYGNWKNWMTESDVDFFRPLLEETMERLGYQDDWEINSEPEISPETSSKYIRSMIKSGQE